MKKNGREEGGKGREGGRKDEECDEMFMIDNEVNIVPVHVHTHINNE
jgi:hypothetical protein